MVERVEWKPPVTPFAWMKRIRKVLPLLSTRWWEVEMKRHPSAPVYRKPLEWDEPMSS
jgi:hypothetical protein